MNRKFLIGLVTVGLILFGAFAVGANKKDLNETKKTTAEEMRTETKEMYDETKGAKTQLPKVEGQEQNKKAEVEPIITKEQATQKAEEKTGGKVVDIELEPNAYRKIYDIELMTTDAEIELEMDADTGDILELRYDSRLDED